MKPSIQSIEVLSLNPNHGPVADFFSQSVGGALHLVHEAFTSVNSTFSVQEFSDRLSDEFLQMKKVYNENFNIQKRMEIAVFGAIDIQIGLSSEEASIFYEKGYAAKLANSILELEDIDHLLFGNFLLLSTLTLCSRVVSSIDSLNSNDSLGDPRVHMGLDKPLLIMSGDDKKDCIMFENTMFHLALNYMRECVLRATVEPTNVETITTFDNLCLTVELIHEEKNVEGVYRRVLDSIWMKDVDEKDAKESEDSEWKIMKVNGHLVLVKR